MTPPTESDVIDAATAVIKATQVPVLGSPPATALLKAICYNRLPFGLTAPGKIMSAMQSQADGGRINGWAVTCSAWNETRVKSKSGASQVPTRIPGFDGTAGDYKIAVQGNLKIWQVYQFDFGDDVANSARSSINERGAVIKSFSKSPRLGLSWPDFEHELLKFPSIVLLPGSDTSLHIAQGNLPFGFTYVATA